MPTLSYTQALNISAYLSQERTKATRAANRLLETKCEEIGRARTFVIVRFGNPLKWSGVIPKGKVKPCVINGKRFTSPAKMKRFLKTPWGNPRAVTMEHEESGRTVKAKSVAGFCKAVGFGGNAKYHIHPVITGQRASYKGWYLPETLAAVLALTDVYGNDYTLTFREWMRRHGLKPGSLFALLQGRRTQLTNKRVTLSSIPFKQAIQPRGDQVVSCTVKGPRGRVIRAANLHQAALKVGLCSTELYPVAYGLKPSASGYTVKSVTVERRKVFA